MTRARTLAAVVLACAVACWLATPASAEDTPKTAAELKEIVRDRAVAAYTSQGGDSSDIAVLFSSDDLLAALRKVRMLDTVNARDDDAISELAALAKDLASEQQDLD